MENIHRKAYIDQSPKEVIKHERKEGIESKYRNASVSENLALWEEMKKGSEIGQKCVMRAKIDMQNKNRVLRDPALYRCVLTPHHRTGTKYKVYPTYDFACPIVDSLEGVTHALRSSEFHDRNPLYDWILQTLSLRHVQIEDFSRLNFKYTVLSKRNLQRIVELGLVKGWDDPAFPTLRGIMRRGLTTLALREFILSQGASKVVTFQEPEKLWALNKKVIDNIIPRFTVIGDHEKVVFQLSNGPTQVEVKAVAKHKKNPELGTKDVFYSNTIYIEGDDAQSLSENEEVTLMDWGNAIVSQVVKNDSGKVSEIKGRLHLEGDYKKTKKKLTWLAAIEGLIPISLITFGHLITKEKLEEDDVIDDFVNQNFRSEVLGVGDSNLKKLNKGERLQLERRGYFICDKVYSTDSPLVLINIPDGKTTDVYKRG